MDKTQYKDRIFLASANSYSGFVSYFGKIFSPESYKKIFVLKGGPGTGKSSLMKRIAKELYVAGADIELFYCSSDPKSLDGVIISSDENKIALIDGTAPHERDAGIPAAIDEIVSLGEGFNTDALESRRRDIEALNRTKAIHYSRAYRNLHISSIFNGYIKAEITELLDKAYLYSSLKKNCDSVFSAKKGAWQERFVGYFSKYGEGEFDTLYTISERIVSVCGEYCLPYFFLNLLAEELIKNGVEFIRFPSPLCPADTDAIYVSGIKTAFIRNGKSDTVIAPEDYFACHCAVVGNAYISDCEQDRIKYLSLAKRELSEASEHHFKLEDVYSSNMDFAKVDAIRESLITRIKKYMSLTT